MEEKKSNFAMVTLHSPPCLVLIWTSSTDFFLTLGSIGRDPDIDVATLPPRGSRASSRATQAFTRLLTSQEQAACGGDSQDSSAAGQPIGAGMQHGSCQLLDRVFHERGGSRKISSGIRAMQDMGVCAGDQILE